MGHDRSGKKYEITYIVTICNNMLLLIDWRYIDWRKQEEKQNEYYGIRWERAVYLYIKKTSPER